MYEYDIGKASDTLVKELFKLKAGETIIITADTESDMEAVNATARSAFAAGAKPMVVITPTPKGVGKAADPTLPLASLTAALKETDAWAELNNQWLLYSTPYDVALKENKRLRHLCLVGMNAGMMIRCVGDTNYSALNDFEERLAEYTASAKNVIIKTPAGTDVSFKNNRNNPVLYDVGYADKPGTHMLGGQISWSPDFESINGKIVFDGSIVPPIGILRDPVILSIKNGVVVDITGGKEAKAYEKWLKSFNDPQMLRLAHVCYGFNPGAKLTGNIVEDERVWGCTEWGIGNVGSDLVPPDGISAISHSDGICLNSSVWLDGKQIIDEGEIMGEELVKLVERIKR